MDLADLVPSAELMRRALLHFFLIGGLLFGARAVFAPQAVVGPELTVTVPAKATDAEVAAKVDEAILINEARRYGWDRSDPVVFDHLVRNMRFIEPESVDDAFTLRNQDLMTTPARRDEILQNADQPARFR